MNKNTKYQNGYLPKIQYWMGKWNEAMQNDDIDLAVRAEHKVEYFTKRQEQVYG
jgi:hypothetical protein